jgi:hypothetical protein
MVLVETAEIEAKAQVLGEPYRNAINALGKPASDPRYYQFTKANYAQLTATWTPERYALTLQQTQQACKSCGG